MLTDHHKKKQQEKEKERLLQEQQQLQLQQQLQQQQLQQMMSPSRYSGGPRFMPTRSPRPFSPRFSSRSPGIRHEPYPTTRPLRRPLNLDQAAGAIKNTGAVKLPIGNNGETIKIEPDDEDLSNQSASDTANIQTPSGASQPSASPHSSAPSTPANVKSESGDKDDDDNKSEEASATCTTPQPSTEVLNLQSDLSSAISSGGDNSDLDKAGTSMGAEGTGFEVDPTIKLEAISESDMELEITGVEPGRPAVPQYDVSLGMSFDPSTSGIDSSAQQSYSKCLLLYLFYKLSPLLTIMTDDLFRRWNYFLNKIDQ